MRINDLILKALSVKYGAEVSDFGESTYTYVGCCGPETQKEVTIHFKRHPTNRGIERGWEVYSGSLESLLDELEAPEGHEETSEVPDDAEWESAALGTWTCCEWC